MQFGFYTDRGLDRQNREKYPWNETKVNSFGYRCPEWDPMPDGKKNVLVLGCSHTFGQGLDDEQHWVNFLQKHNSTRLRYWNLGVPGASSESMVRRLWGTQKLLDPKLIIMCWPDVSRREWYDREISTLHGSSKQLVSNNQHTDLSNWLHCVFWSEKFAEVVNSKIFHCFAQENLHSKIPSLNVLDTFTIANCWPYWDRKNERTLVDKPSYAKDGKHYGVEHHERFAQLFLDKFKSKLK